MSTTLGKRKRRKVEALPAMRRESSEESESEELDAQEIFRRHFEAQFKPLPDIKKVVKVVEEELEGESEEEEDWDGISEEEGGAVQVVEHTDAESRMAAMSKEELKAFMVGHLPMNWWTLLIPWLEFEASHSCYKSPHNPRQSGRCDRRR